MSGSVNNVGANAQASQALSDMSQQQDGEHFSSLVSFNNTVTGSNSSNYTHTTTGGGADKGGSDTYVAKDNSVSYNVHNNNDGTTTLNVSKPLDNNQVELTTTTFGANAQQISTNSVVESDAVAMSHSLGE